MKVICYARVSRDDLNCQNQKRTLDMWVERMKPESCQYLEEQMSSRKNRPIKEGVLRDFRDGKIDTIVVARLDRWARSTIELVSNIEEVIKAGGRFVCVGNGFDFRKDEYDASMKVQLTMMAAFAEFERGLIRERTFDGLAVAKARGKVLGRHPIGCGCGFRSADGKVRHDGPIKPKRDEHNKVVGWDSPPNQTVSNNPPPTSEQTPTA